MGATQPPTKCESDLLPGGKAAGGGDDHPPHIARRLKKVYSYTSIPPLGLRGLFYGDLYLYLYFNEGGSLNGKLHDIPRPKKLAAISKF
jgi:hypothetical protein